MRGQMRYIHLVLVFWLAFLCSRPPQGVAAGDLLTSSTPDRASSPMPQPAAGPPRPASRPGHSAAIASSDQGEGTSRLLAIQVAPSGVQAASNTRSPPGSPAGR